ncbi:MAG: tRNA lysidine(34) synthetase TilS [Planctomycetes bacterium]|nr:tRNA lysidine(34) synthetase TilS [Planctomycetota bacterium]
MDAYPRFLHALSRLPELPRGARIRLALSGGPDSTALLGLFIALRAHRRSDLELSAGHVNHGLRGRESDLDAAHCRELASANSLPHTEERVDVRALAAATRTSLETAARNARLEAFARWGNENSLFAVATGHTADDQVETVLGNILRGTGLRGLRGMRSARPLAGARATLLLRPLLAHARSDLADFCAECGLPYRIDASNIERTFRRNRLRLDLLPYLEREHNPEVRFALLGLAEDAALQEELCAARIAELASKICYGPHIAALKRADLGGGTELPPALLAPLLDLIWERAAGRQAGLNRDHHRAWRELIQGKGDGSSYDLPDRWTLQRAGGWIYVLRAESTPGAQAPVPLRVPGDTPWMPLGLTVSVVPGAGDAGGGAAEISLPSAWLDGTLELRPPRPGDRLALAAGSAEVSETLRARGIPKPLRGLFPVLAWNGTPCWLPAIRRAAASGAHRHLASVRLEAAASPAAFIFARLLAECRDAR